MWRLLAAALVAVLTIPAARGIPEEELSRNLHKKTCDHKECKSGKCLYEDCAESIACTGGVCTFRRCHKPTCPGGLCSFFDCTDPTCDGGNCRYHDPKTTLLDGYCKGGVCQICDNGNCNVHPHRFKNVLTY